MGLPEAIGIGDIPGGDKLSRTDQAAILGTITQQYQEATEGY